MKKKIVPVRDQLSEKSRTSAPSQHAWHTDAARGEAPAAPARSSDRAHVLSWTIQTEHCTSFFTPFDPVESCHPKQSYLRCTELSTLQKPVKVKLHCGAAVATRCQVLPDSPPGAFHWIPTSALQKEPDTSTKLCVVRNDNRAHGCPWVGRAPPPV